jgi:hypothetical protein
MKPQQILFLALLLGFGGALTLSVQSGLAHGDPNLVAVQQELGPYQVTVYTSSNVNDQTHLHLSATVNHPTTNIPVWAAKVYFHIAPIHSGGHVGENIMVVEADQGDPANGFMHDVTLTLPTTGQYEVTVIVRDPIGQGGQVSFDVNVQPVTIWLKITIYSLLVLSVTSLLWLVKEGFTVWTRGMHPTLFINGNKLFYTGIDNHSIHK